jgi:NFU1 iron-sulfur cluster scaffold homolog, mitochondrial
MNCNLTELARVYVAMNHLPWRCRSLLQSGRRSIPLFNAMIRRSLAVSCSGALRRVRTASCGGDALSKSVGSSVPCDSPPGRGNVPRRALGALASTGPVILQRRPAALAPRAPHRTMFIQTQSTPNADAVMFLPGREVMPGGVGSMDFPNLRTAGSSPLARLLLGVDGVRSVFFGAHFITVTKEEGVDWAVVRPEVFEVVMDFFMDDTNEVLTSGGEDGWSSDTAISEDDSEVVAMIKELLETRVKPAVAEDGGSILFRGFHEDKGMVDLELQGACSSCSSSSVTLKSGVENMLRHYIPEVKEVREVFSEHTSELEKTSQEAFSKVEKHLTESGILRS